MKLTNEEFINKAKSIHGDKYDYSNTQYINSRTKVIIICPIHGGFIQRPDQHLAGCGCSKCGHKRKLKEEDIIKRKNIFLQRAKIIHNNKYDYSKVNYINVSTKVCIICPEHGEFWTTPERHVSNKVGCPVCKSKTQKCHKYLTNEEFIKKAKEIHGDKYNYSKINYINGQTKICIICPQHGEFWQTPISHLQGCGCKKCINKLTTEQFIKQVQNKFGDKYTFEKTNYVSNMEKVIITCKKHGDFTVTPNKLLGSNRYCPKCRHEEYFIKKTEKWLNECKEKHKDKFDYSLIGNIIEKNNIKLPIICKKHNHLFYQDINHHLHYDIRCPICQKEYKQNIMKDVLNTFIEKTKNTHGNKYDYSKVKYIGSQTKVCIICSEHGEFWQTPAAHIQGYGCPQCAYNKTSLRMLKTKEEFINDAIKIHGNKYDYSLVDYTDCKLKVKIICPIHGEFEQTPDSHIQGSGCPFCHESKLERQVYLTLIENNINFEREKTFPWLKKKKPLRLDFYLSDYNIAIECQGEQHYKDITFLTMKSNFNEIQERDKIKRNLCEKNGIKIIYYGRLKYDNVIITNIKKLLTEIKKCGNNIIVDP